MSTDVDTVPLPESPAAGEGAGSSSSTGAASTAIGETGVATTAPPTAPTPQEICAEHGSEFVPPAPLDKVAVAVATLGQWPLNAQRITPEGGNCGWYVWGGRGRSADAGFFQTVHVANLLARCPQILPFLALAPGWRVRLSEGRNEVIGPHENAHSLAVRPLAERAYSGHARVTQWVWLSILLHILVVVLFGDATGEGARPGGWQPGRLNVSLAGLRASPAEPPVTLRTETTLSSSRPDRPSATSPSIAKGLPEAPAATVVTPASDSPASAEVPAVVPPAAPSTAEPAPALPPVMPPVIAVDAPTPVTTFVVPPVLPEMTAPPPVQATKTPEVAPPLQKFVAPKIAPPPKVEREIALPTQLLPSISQAVPARAQREATPLEPAVPLKAFTPPTPAKAETETAAAPVELPRMTPLPAPRERTPTRSAEILPRLTPLAPAPVVEAAKPAEMAPRFVPPTPAIETTVTPPAIATTVPPALTPAAPPSLPTVTSAPAQTERGNDATRASTSPPSPTAPPVAASGSPSTSPAQSGTTSSSANSTGSGVTERREPSILSTPLTSPFLPPPPPAATPVPRIDLDSIRRRAREIAEGDAASLRNKPPLNLKSAEDTRTKEQKAFDKALKRPNCREAYTDMGLAAVVPLVRDAVSENGCKW